jgi:hypothetical protein
VRSHSGRLSGARFLIKRVALGAIHKALEHDRPVANAGDRAIGDREVIANEVELRELDSAREVRPSTDA